MNKETQVEKVKLDVNEQVKQRRDKLSQMRKQGIAFPNDFKRHHLAADVSAAHEAKTKEELEADQVPVMMAGRMMTRRVMGKASFATVQDMSGRVQVYFKGADLPDGAYENFKHWDLGDIIAIEGVLFKTKTGELSVRAANVRLMTKALRPLPDKFHGLSDLETRYRQRYLDLIANEDSRRIFQMRSKLVSGIRHYLEDKGFLEVETPMMQTLAGGAAARPFITHHNALDIQLYMRIAPELFLKRCVVGGIEKVFEINRNFRNEGLSTRHNPEFTMLEFYWAYADYRDLMDLTEDLMRNLAERVLGTNVVPYQGKHFDLSKPFKRYTLRDSILALNPEISADQVDDREKAKALAQSLEIGVHERYGLGKIQTEIFEKLVEERLIEPTFITEYPTEVSPLARRNDINPDVTDRFEFFVGGREIANGFSELNDPEDQAERFKQQIEEKEAGDLEAMPYDEDYICALEHGLPPTAGEGIGIDRLTMLFTDSPSIRDVILFPLMRSLEK